MTQRIVVIDYGMGNLHSVVKALEYVGGDAVTVELTDCAEHILNADRVVFPGQGAARDCMRAMRDHGLIDVIKESARTKPFLGICMGLQALMSWSEENDGTECLGVYSGKVLRFRNQPGGARLKIPHMGWNSIRQVRAHPLFAGIDDGAFFYFVHSYYVAPDDVTLTVGVTDYGIEFTSVIAHDNVFAMQCHPEKSAQAGLTLLKNFVQWDGGSR
ncbi:MAG: imidazole glycerol phosphate synthase subunit HisH [Thiotrichales bacterium]